MSNLVLLRGLIRESRHWGDFPKLLAKALPQYNIILPEIQGVGKYHEMTSPSNFDEMIHFMREQIKDSLIDQKNIIIAISLGGMIAKRWSELYPDDFQKMILINTSFKGINSLFHRVRLHAIKEFLAIFKDSTIEGREKKIVRLVSNRAKNHDEMTKRWIQIQKEAPVNKKSYYNQVKAALTFSPSKEKPKQELLILAGKKDRLCSYKSSLKLNSLWDSNIHLHESAGHDLPSDEPQWLINNIKNFIEA